MRLLIANKSPDEYIKYDIFLKELGITANKHYGNRAPNKVLQDIKGEILRGLKKELGGNYTVFIDTKD